MPPQYLPHFVATISPYLPTRQLGDLLWSVVGEGNASRAVMGLVLYSAIFGLLAAVGYRRDERKRYA
jgi:ABC-2 type transport system permease protein